MKRSDWTELGTERDLKIHMHPDGQYNIEVNLPEEYKNTILEEDYNELHERLRQAIDIELQQYEDTTTPERIKNTVTSLLPYLGSVLEDIHMDTNSQYYGHYESLESFSKKHGNPSKGDMFIASGVTYIYDGTTWESQ